MEVEPGTAKAVQMPPLLQLQKLPGKGDAGLKKKSVFVTGFLADQKIAISCVCVCGGGGGGGGEETKKKRFAASYSTSNKLLLVARHSDYGPPEIPLKLAM